MDNQTGDQLDDQMCPSDRENLQAESVETSDTFQICLWIGLSTATILILIGWSMVKHSERKIQEQNK